MAEVKYKAFDNLPDIRPATAVPGNYQDSLMRRTSQTAEESERLDKILAHYEKDLEREIREIENGKNDTRTEEETGEATVDVS